jgi:mannose-6-phosphate isomerase-like protein (cupin superfamily)
MESFMAIQPINLKDKLSLFTEQYSPRIVARMNDCHFKVAKFRGDFVWHSHPETDETFLVVEGEMRMDFREGSVRLKTGEMLVVPRGIEHKPYAEDECQVLLVEPAGTVNTGNAGGEMTVEEDVWI